MRHRKSFTTALMSIVVGLLPGLIGRVHAETAVDCSLPPQAIIKSAGGTDPVEKLQRAGKALETCGDTRYLDLLVDRTTLDIPPGAHEAGALAGTWVSDMWLHVEEGVTAPIAEILSISEGAVEQGFVRWHDPDDRPDPSYLSAYMPQIGTARLAPGAAGWAIAGFEPSTHRSIHNPYGTITGPEPDRHQHQMMAVIQIHLGRITGVRVSGDRLLLVDERGIVRTYRRHKLDDLLASHRFFLAANVNARSWPCLLGVLSRRLGDKATQDEALVMVARTLTIQSLAKSVGETNAGLKEVEPQSQKALELIAERDRLATKMQSLMDAEFQAFVSRFDDPDQRPAFCSGE